MKQFEYCNKLINYLYNSQLIDKLNEFGSKGWEFCAFDEEASVKTSNGYSRAVILKREITTV